MLRLDNVTLCAIGSTDVEGMLEALKYSCRDIKFGEVKLITDAKVDPVWAWYINEDGQQVDNYIQVCPIDPITSIDQWNHDVIYKLPDYITTKYALLIHPDGFVVNPDCWRDEFLEYDYIGAPWPLPTDDYSYRDEAGEIVRVGNSVSLRSKALMDLPKKLELEWKSFYGNTNEDGFLCCHHKKTLEFQGCKFAPIEVARYFSHEVPLPETAGIKPFAFHKHAGSNKDYPNFENIC